MRWRGLLLTAVLFLVLLTACGLGQLSVPVATATPQEVALVPTLTPLPSATLTPLPSATHTAVPPSSTPTKTPTATPTLTPSVTHTSTPRPTPKLAHPLMIERMRQVDYPGSEITFEQTLEPGVNYDRYIISYESEGHTIYALFTVPWGTPPLSGWPVILFNHGWIDPEIYRTTERYIDYVDAIARSGYIVLRSDYRGHGNSEGEAVNAYRSPGYTADVLNALAAVKTYEDADPQRIGMWGHSMGGFITLRSMVISDEIKAGVIWGGVVVSYPDLFSRWRRSEPDEDTATPDPTREARRRRSWFNIYGTPEENPEFWAAMSSNSFLEDISGPVQLHHGTADDSVPYEFSEILAAELEAAGNPVELYLYDGDNHNLVISFWTAMNRSIEFFDRYVKGEE